MAHPSDRPLGHQQSPVGQPADYSWVNLWVTHMSNPYGLVIIERESERERKREKQKERIREREGVRKKEKEEEKKEKEE
ncbi:hypothetical protein F8M41_014118 [Gigaspora margarita]|uniref:Uncharacterized protein n=1 Tax=Gigaspora margarita TaxID=4874 RepID=A0A8H3WVS6_GIGMA|nr:hypothetical protein F8M41_014118 [Gigaspora margarita]